MQQNIIIIVISVAVGLFFITNHFKRQEITERVGLPFLVFAIILITNFLHFHSLHAQLTGLALRFVTGILIGILQGMLAEVRQEGDRIYTKGTFLGMAFWLIFLPVRLVLLPWFAVIAPGTIDLNSPAYMGITAEYILTGFFLAKAVILLLRKKSFCQKV